MKPPNRELYRVTLGTKIDGVVSVLNGIVETAPAALGWLIGERKRWLVSWCEKRGGTIAPITEESDHA